MAPSDPSIPSRKRRRPGAASVRAALLLLACSGVHLHLPRIHNCNLPVAAALVAPSAHRLNHRTNGQLAGKDLSFGLAPRAFTPSALASSAVDDAAVAKKKKSTNSASQRRKRKPSGKGSHRNNARIIKKPFKAPAAPWDADYHTSVQTQRRIQAAARSNGHHDSVTTAQAVLDTLLDAPPEECNAANVVCALTLSSKVLGRRGGGNGSSSGAKDSLQAKLLRTIAILRQLVDANKLSPRQLCNAAWGLAKHVERNPSLIPRKENFVVVKEGGGFSTWDLRSQPAAIDNPNGEDDELVDETLDSVARRVVEHLEGFRREASGKEAAKRVQPGELSMLLWAYAVAKPRDCPPGWEGPRRVERLSNKEKRANLQQDDDVDFVTFVELEDPSISSDDMGSDTNTKEPETSVTSKLFDAAAIAFCQGEGSAVSSKGDRSTTLLKQCTWSELSNIAWSYAARGAYGTREGEAMMTFFAREATRRIDACAWNEEGGCDILPRDAVQIAWALGTMESDNVSAGDALVRLVDAMGGYWIDGSRDGEWPLSKWACADLVQMATALAHGRLDNPTMLEAVYAESLRRLEGLSPSKPSYKGRVAFSTGEISILMWVQARLYLTPKFGDVYGAFPGAASRALLRRMEGKRATDEDDDVHRLLPAEVLRRKGLGPQEQANLAWSLTVLEDYSRNVVALLRNIFYAASSDHGDGVVLEHAHQLWQSYFLLSSDCPEAVEHVPGSFSSFLERKWNAEKSRDKRSSNRHRLISQTLNLMRVAHRNEYDEDVDVAIVLDEDSAWTHMAQDDFDIDQVEVARLKVAVEFDGPHHFTVAASTGEDLAVLESGGDIKPRVLGHTVLKYRLLKKKGWTVVRIPYYEFDKIPFWASMERQRYLQRALKTHDKIEFSGVDVSEYKAMPSTRHSRFD
ncbi:hypothetical protein ACHAXT_002053 [Thalassiosira profunda]